MRILFGSGGGYYPEMTGGVQASTDHLIRQSIAAGHEAGMLASLFGNGVFGWKRRIDLKLRGGPATTDHGLGYPVTRAWFPENAVDHAVEKFSPDVALIQCHKTVPMAKEFEKHGVPVVVYLRNVEFEELGGDLRDLSDTTYIANSRFTADRYREKYGFESTVIPPTINPDAYRTETSGRFITFINVYPEKGFEKALEIAGACPDIPFLFLESWKLSDDHRAEVEKAVSALPNVTFEARTSDMKTVYRRTKILLAPSKWEEAWGRVASEAHCSGIPVVGSNRGGLPEAIGKGGIALDYDAPLADWVDAVTRLWNDGDFYQALSTEAKEFARRPEMDADRQFLIFLAVLDRAIKTRSKAAA